MGKLYQFKSRQQLEEELINKEYKEFVQLLQYFLETQIPRCEVLKVKISNNSFVIYDNQNQKIDNTMEYNEFDYDDVLISNLISFAPKKIEIIQCDNKKVLNTIKDIFIDKVIIA